MKKLSTEEKAKRYDEALKRARKIENGEPINVPDGASIPAAIFPELYESEGGRIRKQIISFLKEFEYDHYRCLDFSSWIAWLEKQGEQSSNILWHDVSEEPENNREIFCKWKGSEDNTWHDVVFYRTNDKTFWSGGKNQIKHVIEWAYVDDLLEKQGEQKSVDKVEPKFNLYDWVVTDKGDVVQIGAVNNGYYTIHNGMDFNMSYVDKFWHLWTIEDAKDGDVLAGKIDGDSYILIYKQIKDGWIETYGHYYDSVDRFCVPSQLFCREVKGNFCPATKEQRDVLFQKMKEAGYEWDADKKELIKL